MCEKKMQNDELIRNLSRQFGSYRAEWSGDDLYRHFTTPCYFASLGEFKACVFMEAGLVFDGAVGVSADFLGLGGS